MSIRRLCSDEDVCIWRPATDSFLRKGSIFLIAKSIVVNPLNSFIWKAF